MIDWIGQVMVARAGSRSPVMDRCRGTKEGYSVLLDAAQSTSKLEGMGQGPNARANGGLEGGVPSCGSRRSAPSSAKLEGRACRSSPSFLIPSIPRDPWTPVESFQSRGPSSRFRPCPDREATCSSRLIPLRPVFSASHAFSVASLGPRERKARRVQKVPSLG